MKIRKALLAENNETITPKEYERRSKEWRDKKELRCSCGAKLSFVETYTRMSSKGNPSIVSAFFRDSKTSVHKEDCLHNISNRKKKIVEESQCLPIINGKYFLSLKNPCKDRGTETDSETLSYNKYSKTIFSTNKYYNNYLKTVIDILRLRDDLESNVHLSEFVLHFGTKQIKWEDFYCPFNQYKGILKAIKNGHPIICVEGNIYLIGDENKPSLFLYGEKIEHQGKDKTIAIKLVSKEVSLIKNYPNGCPAIIYGAVSWDKQQPSEKYLNFVMWINDPKQISKIEE